MVTYLLDVVARRNQFLLTGRIDPVITGTGDGGRRHAEMNLGGARVADQLHQGPARRAPHDRIVDHDDLLTLEDLAHGIELDLDLRHAAGLRGVNERAADVMVANQRVLQLDPGLLRETERHGVGRIGHRKHAVRPRGRMLAGQLVPQGPAYAVHGPVEYGAVGARKVDQLEHAAAPRPRQQRRQLVHLIALDADEVPGLELPHDRRASDVERARFGRHDPAASQATEHERPEAAGIDDGVARATDGHEQRVGAFDSLQSVEQLVFRLARLEPGEQGAEPPAFERAFNQRAISNW